MAARRQTTRAPPRRRSTSKPAPRRRRSMTGKINWKRIAKGAGFGIGVSILGNFLGRRAAAQGNLGRGVQYADLGQRAGSVVAAKFGGWEGNAAYQLGDYIIDRWVTSNAGAQFGSGTYGGVIRG